MKKGIYMEEIYPHETTGTVEKWHKRVGETIVAGEILYEVKVQEGVRRLAAPFDGELVAIFAGTGAEVESEEVVALAHMIGI